MNLDEYRIKSIIDEIDYIGDKYHVSAENIIKIYLIKELKELNEQIEEYINYKYNE